MSEHAAEPVLEFYCPGCGARYEMPGICIGSPEGAHPALAVSPVTDPAATTENATPAADTVTQPAEPASASGSGAADTPTAPPPVSDAAQAGDAAAAAAAAPEQPAVPAEVVDQQARDAVASLQTTVDALTGRVENLEAAGTPDTAKTVPAPPGGFPS